MAGLASLVGGFQQGVDWKQGVQQRQQQRRALEYGLQQEGESQAGRRSAIDRQRAKANLPAVNYAGLQDPYAFNLANTIKSVFSPSYRAERKAQAALPVDPRTYGPGKVGGATTQSLDPGAQMGPPAPQQMGPATAASTMPYTGPSGQGIQVQKQKFADGGEVDENDPNYGLLGGAAAAAPMAIKPLRRAAGAVARGAGAAGRKVAGAIPRAVAPIALGATAGRVAGTPTEQYRERFGMETNDPSLAGDVGVRALGAASDLGNTLTGGLAGRFYRDLQEEGVAAPTPEEVAVTEQVPAEEPMEISPPESAPAATPQQGALPTSPDGGGEFDWASVDIMPDDIPSMSTTDWVDYRQQSVADLMLQGQSEKEANDEVTGLQQNGFMQQAKQAQMLMQGGNMQAAARALKAAYQYFPNGADVKFGIQGNALIGMGTDEETGEPSGKPMILDEERLAAMIANFQDPKNFLAWTKDWRAEKFKERKYQEVDKPEAQSMADYRATTGAAALENAQAAQMRATTAGAGGGQRSSDVGASEEFFRGELQMQGVPEEDLPQLATVMAEIRVRVPQTQLSDSKILQDIMLAYQGGTLDQIVEQLGIR